MFRDRHTHSEPPPTDSLSLQHFYYHRYLPINTAWLLITISGIAFSFGAGLGVLILLIVQVPPSVPYCIDTANSPAGAT